MLQNVFQSFFVAAQKPKLGLKVIIVAGVTNMVLDYLFVGCLGFGLQGQQLRQYAENLLADCSRFFILHEKIQVF